MVFVEARRFLMDEPSKYNVNEYIIYTGGRNTGKSYHMHQVQREQEIKELAIDTSFRVIL